MSGRIHLALGGEVADLRKGQSHAWTLSAGVDPHVGEFILRQEAVAEIFTRAGAIFRTQSPNLTTRIRGLTQPVGPITLEIDGGPGPTVKIRGLYVIARMAGDDLLNTETLLVADRRWLWRTLVVERRYNVRRPTPQKRWIDGALVELGFFQAGRVESDLTHERITLDNGVPYTAERALQDVLAHLCGAGGFVISARPRFQGVIQDTELHDQGPSAMQRILAEVPGIQPYAHPDGRVHLLDVFDGSDRAAFAAHASTPLAGSWSVQDRSVSISRRFFCGFEREHEIRFDYVERDATALDSATRQTPGREEPTIDNVAPITDPTLSVGGVSLAMGTWQRILEDLIPAWTAATSIPAAFQLTQAKILRFYLAGLSPIYAYYRRVPGTEDPLLARRVSSIQEHFRRTFRISQQWMDKLRFVAARRASIVSQETGARARADAFFDYVVKPTLLDLANRGQVRIGAQVTGFATLLKDSSPAPADVQVIDPLVGIIRITPRVSLTGTDLMIAPGTLDGPFPEADAAARFVLWNQVPLSTNFRLSVVLTGSPSVPNDETRLWWQEVSLEDAANALGAPVPSATGPDRQILCGDSIARFAWLDSRAADIKESIWTGKRPPEDLLVNQQEVRDQAVAQAARVLSPLLPRVVGRAQVPLDGSIVPAGNLQRVTHGVSVTGAGTATAWTTMSAPSQPAQAPSGLSLLPARTRKIVARLIEE